MAGSIEALETIELLYRAAVEPKLWPDALQSLAQAVGCVGTAMIPITPQNTAGLVVSPELQEPNIEYEREWWKYDSRVLRIHSRGLSDGVCCEAQLFTDEEVARDPLRQEFLRKYGIGAFAAQLVPALPDFVVAFSVQRALNGGHFERHELETLNLLGRHAARALMISTRLAASRQQEATLANALTQFDCGALVIDRQARVLFANDAARRFMGDGLRLREGRLLPSSRDHDAAFARFLDGVLRLGSPANSLGPIALPRPGHRQPLIVQAIPISGRFAEWSVPDCAALLLVVDSGRGRANSPIDALRLLGLTRSEARLGALIGAGYSRSEAAAELGISKTTVSDTIKQVYAKLDISRQSELVRLVDRLAVLKSRREDAADA